MNIEKAKPKCLTCNDTGVVCDDEDLGGHAVTNSPCPDCKPEPIKLTEEWKNKAKNILVLAHIKEQEDMEVAKSWTFLSRGILELCKEIDRLMAENKSSFQEIDILEATVKQQAERIKELEGNIEILSGHITPRN